jgi:hypothetical protein
MQHHRNGGTAAARQAVPPPPVDRVCGLGVCDVLRIEIDGSQLESLRDEIQELQHVIDEAITAAAAGDDDDDLHRLRYEREALDIIARQLGVRPNGERIVVVGPARLISELVGGAARDAGERLVDHLGERPPRDGASAEALIAAADVAAGVGADPTSP